MIKLNFRFFKRLPAKEKRLTISTILTLMRIAMTPLIVYCMVKGLWYQAGILFIGASLTDILDGNIARWRQEQTFLGACLDPIADKFLIISCFFTLAFIRSPLFIIPSWFFGILLVKEILLIAGAIVLYGVKGYINVRPILLGKVATCTQMLFIIWIFMCYFLQWFPIKTYYVALSILVVLMIGSLLQYGVMGVQWFYHDV